MYADNSKQDQGGGKFMCQCGIPGPGYVLLQVSIWYEIEEFYATFKMSW